MKQLRHVLALTLVFCMVFGMVTPSLAVSGEISVEEDYGIPVEEDGGIEIEVDDRSDYDIDEDREELSVLPKQDETADETNTTDKVDGYNYNIIHLDCGRKYFSVDSIKQIIDNASAAGFNYIQLAVGNDGMRFLLDDMSLTVNGTTYSSDAVTAAIHAGNETYNKTFTEWDEYKEENGRRYFYTTHHTYTPDVNELTQTEMDSIIAYAYEKGMGVIPLINTPGHMDAILSAATSLTGTNCSYNGSARTIDVTNTTAVAFTKAFLTKYIDYFKGKGCTLFNMGADEYANDIYTGGSMGFGNLQDSNKYSYYVTYVNEVADLIKNKGMKPIAFNDGIYFNDDKSGGTFRDFIIIEYWSSGWSSYRPMSAANLASKGHKLINTNGDYYWVLGKPDAQCSATKASGFETTTFAGGTISNPVGSTFCIWCDYPGDYPGEDSTKTIEGYTKNTIDAFGARVKDYIDNGGTTDPTPTPGTGDVVPVELTVGGRKEFSQTGDAQKTQTEDTTVATVTLTPVYGTEMKETPLTSLNSTTSFYIKNSEGKYLNESAQWVDDYLDAIKWVYYNTSYIGNYLENANPTFYLQYDSGWKIVNRRNSATYIYFNEGCLYRSRSEEWSWDDFEYKYTYSNPLGTPVTFTTTTSTTPESTTVTITGKAPTADLANGCTTAVVGNGDNAVTYNITVNAIEETKSLTVSSGKTAALNVPALDESIVGNTTTTFDVTIGSEYITVDENGTITAGTVTEDKTATVVAKVKNAAGAVLATYTYNVTITKEDLTKVTPITVEYWITNSRITGNKNNKQELTITASEVYGEDGVDISKLVDPDGTLHSRTQEYWQSKILDVEKTNTSTSGTELQTTKNGDDETLNGSAFTKIRYYNSKWQVYTTDWTDVDRKQVRVDYTNDNSVTETYSGDKNQLVAYYMEVVDINNADGKSELHVNAADWGFKGDGKTDWSFDPRTVSHCSVSVQIVYEDNTTNPIDTTAINLQPKTIVYGYWDGGRGLGTMIFSGQQNYQIYKVTAETGTMTSSTSNFRVTTTRFDWHDNEVTVWGGNTTEPVNSVSIGNPAKAPSYEGVYDHLAWNRDEHCKNNAILIRVYVKTAITPDTLRVFYYDNNRQEVFYDYGISVAPTVKFNPGFGTNDRGELVNNTVTNTSGVVQTINSNLRTMSAIKAYYRYSNYTFKSAELKNEGTEAWLYYEINNNHEFVVDFGVPFHIEPKDIIDDAELLTKKWDIANITEDNVLNYGKATARNGEGLTYTPTKIMQGYESIAVDLKDSNDPDPTTNTATHFIYLYPATNVLYEENVITNPAGSGWTTTGTSTINATTTQATEKLGEENLHGYDNVYDEVSNTEFSGGSAYKAELTLPAGQKNIRTSGELSFTFTGTGFDLISECGKDTGALLVKVYRVNADNTKTLAHGFLVDTYFSGDETYIKGNGILDYQVPVVRDFIKKTVDDELVDDYGTYEVNVKGFLLSNSGAVVNSTNAISTYSSQNVVEETLASLGIPEEDFDLYEVVYMDDNSVLNGGTGAETSVVKSDIATFVKDIAMDNALELNDATDGAKTANVYVDGIRIYNTIDPSKQPGYKTSEKNTEYYNVYDFVLNSSAGTSDQWDTNSAIYIEKDGNTSLYKIADYKKQGPENEIYLTAGNAVVFALDGYDLSTSATVHVAAKAVSGNPIFAGNDIYHSTELYYDVNSLVKHSDKYGYYIILKNNDNSNSVLSISGIKVSSNIQLVANEELGDYVVKKLNPAEDDKFKPDEFSASIPASVKKGRRFVVNISASTDVDSVTVTNSDGTIIGTKTKSQADNSGDVLRYSIIAKAPNETGTYKIYVYATNENKINSAKHELTITVK